MKHLRIVRASYKLTLMRQQLYYAFAFILFLSIPPAVADPSSENEAARRVLFDAPRWEDFVKREGAIYAPEKSTPYTGPVALRYGNEGLALAYCRDGMLHGTSTSWYPDGEKRSEHTYARGLLHGLSTTWHPNGQKMNQGNYQGGKLHGIWITWDAAGTETGRKHYRKGKPIRN